MAKNLIPKIAKMLNIELGEEFKVKGYDELQLKRIRNLNAAARYLEYRINELCPKGRERKIALQKLEEVMMWANKAIAFEGADK